MEEKCVINKSTVFSSLTDKWTMVYCLEWDMESTLVKGISYFIKSHYSPG